MKLYPYISIVFPNFNGGDQPLGCLSSIQKLNYPKEKIEVIVIDNNSTDGSADEIAKYKMTNIKFKLVRNKFNEGFAKAINKGIKLSRGSYILIGNDDIEFDKNSILKMVKYIKSHQNVGVIGGKIYQKNNNKKVISAGYMMNKWTGDIYMSPEINKITEPDWVQGCAMFVPKNVFDKIGLLDEEFSLIYFEDFDFCMRARKNGFKTIYLPSAIFWHGNTVTMNKDKSNKYYQWYKNKIRFTIKNLPILNVTTILMIQLFLTTPYRAFILRDKRFIPFIKGFLWNVKYLSSTISRRRFA